MALELSEMRSFIALCEERHFGRTAESLNISQPALSKQVRRLEDRLGGALLIRRSNGLHLTPAGDLFLQQARLLVADADATERITRLALQGEAGMLRVGFGVAVLARGLPDVIMRFRRRFPAVHLSVKNMSTSDQLQALSDRSIDIGFVRLPVTADHIEAVPLITERLMVVLGKQHGDVPDGLSGLHNEPFILPCRADSASFYDHVLRTCRAAGFVPRIVQETDVFFTALNLVRAGLGLSIAPRALLQQSGPAGASESLPCHRRQAGWTLSFSPKSAMASASALTPMPKARSTMRASPRMSWVRLNTAACPLRSARITSNPMMVA